MNITHVRWRIVQYTLGATAGGLAWLLYASTAAPWLTWAHDGADGGDLIAAAMTWGVPHPTGYPTYCLLARLFARLPLGNIARRFNLFSGAMAAATIVLVYLAALRLLRGQADHERDAGSLRQAAIAWLTALTAAAGYTLWSQAIIAEVYTLNAFFLMLCLYLAICPDRTRKPAYWAMLGLSLGVGLGAHVTLVLAVPGMLILLRPKATARGLLACALGLLCGTCVYAYIPIAARAQPPVNWGDAHTWEGFRWLVSGKLYWGYAFALPIQDLPNRLGAFLGLWGREHTLIGVALALVGLWSWIDGRRYAWALGTGIIFSSYTLYAALYNTADSYVYLIPAYLVASLWLAAGAGALLTEAARARSNSSIHVALTLLLLCAMPAWSIATHYQKLNLANDQEAAQWVQATLAELPKQALVITGDDRHTFALEYVCWVEHKRTDLLVVDGELWSQPWYARQMVHRYPSLRTNGDTSLLEELVGHALEQHSIFLTTMRNDLAQKYQIATRGNLVQIINARSGAPLSSPSR